MLKPLKFTLGTLLRIAQEMQDGVPTFQADWKKSYYEGQADILKQIINLLIEYEKAEPMEK